MAGSSQLLLEITTPSGQVLRKAVEEVLVPGTDGDFGILPGHVPMLATLRVGELWYRAGLDQHFLLIAFGFAEVLADRVNILADVAEQAADIDLARAKAAKERAESRLRQATADINIERARIALTRSLSRLRVGSRRG